MNYVIGGNGFIGSNIVRTCNAIIISHDLRLPVTGKLTAVQDGDIVFHTAHFGSIDECAKNPEATRAINITGTKLFFDEVKNRGGFPVYFSTNMVFDGNKDIYTEADIPNPSTEYGKQKLEVEQYIQSIFEKYLIIRMTKVYGPGSTSFIDSWVTALANNQEIRAAHDVYAAPVFIDDVMRVLEDILPNQYSGVCHISGPTERSMNEIAQIVMSHTNADSNLLKPISMNDLSLTEKRSVHNCLACDTLKKQGCRIPRDIPEILREFYS